MKRMPTTLYSFAAPFALLLPVMDFHFSDIPAWFKGTEFLTLVSQFLIQFFTGLADVLIAFFVESAFAA
jgi:hypothetical protein